MIAGASLAPGAVPTEPTGFGPRASGPSATGFVPLGFVALTTAIGIAAMTAPTVPLLGLAVALVVAALVPSRPWLGLFVLAATSWANLSEVAATRNGLPSLDRILLPGLAALVLWRWWSLRERPGGDREVVVLLAAVGASIAISLLVATHPELVAEALDRFARDALLVLVTVALIRAPRDLALAVWGILAGGTAVSVACLAHLLFPDQVGDVAGLARSVVMNIAGDVDSLRLVGPLDDPNSLGQILLPLLPLAWSRAVHETRPALRATAVLAGLVAVAALLATYSRSALLVAVVVAGLCWLAWHRHRLLPPVLVGICAIAALPWLPATWTGRLAELGAIATGRQTGVDRALSGRLDEMRIALRMFADHPIAGVGVRHYPARFERYASSERLRPRGEARSAHSLPLEIAAERGIIGSLLVGGALLAVALRMARVRRALLEAPGPAGDARLVESVALALVAYGGMSLVLHENYTQYMWLLVALGLATPALLAGGAPASAGRLGPSTEIAR